MAHLMMDILMISLLVMAIVFCWKLNIRLRKMREMGEDLSPFMRNLSIYLSNITTSIDKLKYVADVGAQGLNEAIPTAKVLKDDFDILIEHSEKIAKRLDEVIEKARQMDHQLYHTMRLAEKTQRKEATHLSGEPEVEQSRIAQERAAYRSSNNFEDRLNATIQAESFSTQPAGGQSFSSVSHAATAMPQQPAQPAWLTDPRVMAQMDSQKVQVEPYTRSKHQMIQQEVDTRSSTDEVRVPAMNAAAHTERMLSSSAQKQNKSQNAADRGIMAKLKGLR